MKEIVSQVVSYPNLIPLCIDAFYTTLHFYHDLVPYSILQYLIRCKKETIDFKCIGISLWLQNIASFTGEFFRSYYKTELTGLLNYVSDCLVYGQVAQIFILKQILAKMSGWNPPENLTEKMLKSLAGGPKLKIAAYKLGEDRSKTTKSSAYLCNALQEKWPGSSLNYFLKIAILSSQQASAILYSQSCNFKILTLLYDNLISSIILMVDIMFLQLKQAKSYSELLPSNPIVVLSKTYNLPLPIVMYIVRPGIDISNIENVTEQLKVIEPDCKIPIQFFAVFWALSLSDIKSAEAQYNQEMVLLLEGSGKPSAKNQTIIDNLTSELSFLKRKQDFFAEVIKKYSQIPKDSDICTELVQKGIYPRLLCSPGDALYCAYFIETLLKLQINDFPVFRLIEKCIVLILPCLHCCTEGEASNIGFFFLELLTVLSNWKHALDSESKPGYLKDLNSKGYLEHFENFHGLISKILLSGLQSSNIVQKNCLNFINRIFAEFPCTKETTNDILKSIEPLKESNHEDLKLIAQRIYDNLRVKFAGHSRSARPALPAKRSKPEGNGHRKSSSREKERERERNDKKKYRGGESRSKHGDKGYRYDKND